MKLEIKTEDLKEAGLLQEFATLFGLTTEELLSKTLFVKEGFPTVAKTEDEPKEEPVVYDAIVNATKEAIQEVTARPEPILNAKDLVDTIHALAKALDLEVERRGELSEKVEKLYVKSVRADLLDNDRVDEIEKLREDLRSLRRNENTITKAIEKLGGDVKQVKDMRLADVNQFVRSRIALMGRLDALEKGARPTENEKTGLNL